MERSRLLRLLGASFLFLTTAAVVVWQNSRVGIVWDAAYILENSWRISLGELPYRDFPFPYAPLTYLLQAGIIVVTGRVFWHHIAYAAIAAGVASVFSFSIIETLLIRRRVPSPSLISFLLSLPLAFLGIYCIFPHPFYDPDCCLAILVSLWLLLRAGESPWWTVFAGLAIVVPIFVKQNIGLLYSAVAEAGLILQLLVTRKEEDARRWRQNVLLSSWMAGAIALIVIQLTTGLKPYYRWTIEFAAERRLPPFAEQLQIYRDPLLWGWVACALAGIVVYHFGARARAALATGVAALLITAPFLWIWYSYWNNESAVDSAYYLITLWPFVMIVAMVIVITSTSWWRDRDSLVPLLLIVAIEGCFLSHSAEGSSYGIWPMLMILIATLFPLAGRGRMASVAAALISISLMVPAWFYMSGQQRLHYIDRAGEIVHSHSPALSGFSVAGPYLPDFDELLDFTRDHIPRNDALLCIPGEDLFYFATGRHPQFPVLLFDHTVNPYSAAQIASLADGRKVRWLIIKKRLQIRGAPMTNEKATLALLRPRFRIVGDLRNYVVWKRM
ncbi:MAG TPA: hypothetical protein VHL58_18520 [Thermoanaerobaculia bacterium]|nr:hypothetical protein [Thermoanaerobaculia bacterium]